MHATSCSVHAASPKTTIMKLTKLPGKLSFTAQAVLPGTIQCRENTCNKNKFRQREKQILIIPK